jgi:hypothetical protein
VIGELPCNPSAEGWQGVIYVGTEPFYANDPDAHLWELDCAKADLDNDMCLTGYDIDPFVMILMGQYAEFEAAFPGLSWETGFYHADMDCNGLVNGYDIDPFVARLTEHTTPDCAGYIPDCPGDGGGEMAMGFGAEGVDDSALGAGDDPAAMAALLASSVAPERLPLLIETLASLPGQLDDPQRAEFWAEVAAALSAE